MTLPLPLGSKMFQAIQNHPTTENPLVQDVPFIMDTPSLPTVRIDLSLQSATGGFFVEKTQGNQWQIGALCKRGFGFREGGLLTVTTRKSKLKI